MSIQPLKIFSRSNSARLKYIAGILLGDILGLSYEIITDKRKLGKSPVINYSNDNISGSFKISPDKILFETGVQQRDILVEHKNSLPFFFKASNDSDFHFDVFAASFFLVSRYEEYPGFYPDMEGRFNSSYSLASKYGFLNKPVVDLWAGEMARALLRKFQFMAFRRHEFRSLVAIENDHMSDFDNKSLLDTIGGFIRSLKIRNANEDVSSDLSGKEDQKELTGFDYLIENVRKMDSDVRLFFPIGAKGESGRNHSLKNSDLGNLIRRLADEEFVVGLNTSGENGSEYSVIKSEIGILNNISRRTVSISQISSSSFSFPKSYSDLITAGIREDYSMGYDDALGFRAGIARPFVFYDLNNECATDLIVVPFQFLDTCFREKISFEPENSMELINKLIEDTKKVGGLLVSTWHTSFFNNGPCTELKGLFEYMLESQKS